MKLGELHLELGDDEVAAECLHDAWQQFHEASDVLGEMDVLPRLIEARVRLGALDVARQELNGARAILADLPDWASVWGDFSLAEALFEVSEGDQEGAEAAFNRADGVYKACGLKWDEARLLEEWGGALALAGTRVGTESRAARLLGEALEKWERMGVTPCVERCGLKLSSLEARPSEP